MRDHQEAFSPTVPDDVDDYVPAPGDPSGERPEYEGTPSFSKDDGHPALGEPSLHRDLPLNVEPDDVSLDVVNEPSGAPLERPPTNGAGSGKEAWVAYAMSLGHTAEQLEPYSRDELIGMFSG